MRRPIVLLAAAALGAVALSVPRGTGSQPQADTIRAVSTTTTGQPPATSTTEPPTTTTEAPPVTTTTRPPPPTTSPPVPAPRSDCETLVASTFPDDAAWALATAARESHCTDVVNTRETCTPDGGRAMGVFQLCMPTHSDLVVAVCPGRDPLVAVLDTACNVAAARALYEGAGRRPWGG